MCGRYAQGFAVRAVAEQLERGEMGVDDIRELDNYYPSYNVAPTNYQPVYRRERSGNQDGHDVPMPDEGASGSATSEAVVRTERERGQSAAGEAGEIQTRRTRRILQGMRWGLIPFWTKRAPESKSQLKTINCRDDSLFEDRGLWNSMKGRKRCIIPVQGYYEWLKKGPKEKIPHFTKRKDGQMMMLAGLYDSVQYEGSEEKLWTYTIITTSSSKELSWLHDRMPLILDQGSDAINRWLDDDSWSQDLLKLLNPYKGELDCYPVKKDVGKVGHSSPEYIVPVDSKENRSNIANFFQKQPEADSVKLEATTDAVVKLEETDKSVRALDNHQQENNAPMPALEEHLADKKVHTHPRYPKSDEDVLYEDDLPFKFIPSHLESRPLETMDVFTAAIEPRSSGPIIQFVNAKLKATPDDLGHLKRIKSNNNPAKRVKLEDGSQAPVPVEILLCSCSSRSEADLLALLRDNNIEIRPTRTQVSKYPPLTTHQFAEWCKLWPLTWRVPAQRKVKLPRLQFQKCQKIMTSMLDSAALMANSPDLPVTAVAYDPVTDHEVARASDARASSGHPLRHAIMDLVSSVAAHETIRRLDNPDSEARYLCSNLFIFVTHEPCSMCAMALLHSRVSHVFYAQKMDLTGGFESTYGIHWRAELNHRFIVFSGWMKERAMYLDERTDTDDEDREEVQGGEVVQRTEETDLVDDLEWELFGNHAPRSFTRDDLESSDFPQAAESDNDASLDHDGKSPGIVKSRSQPRKARPRLSKVKKTPKVTDFFGKQQQ